VDTAAAREFAFLIPELRAGYPQVASQRTRKGEFKGCSGTKTVATPWKNLLTRCFVDFLSSMRLIWSKSEQSKQSLASRGL
jgi:hypothetical protein